MAASAVGAGVGQAVGGALDAVNAFKDFGVFGQGLAIRAASGFAGGLTTAALRGGRISATQVAVDAFGNALGDSLAGANGQGSRDGSDSLDAFLALAGEELVRGVLNIPSAAAGAFPLANQAGTSMAIAFDTSQPNEVRIAAALAAARDYAGAFVGLENIKSLSVRIMACPPSGLSSVTGAPAAPARALR